MNRAIELAKNAIRSAYPNPAVGCVIVHQNKIIGEGYTSPYGGPHAEVNAIASVKDPSLLIDSELYVTLEPCAHFGKTPPCANLIVSNKIPRVFIGLLDPNPQVAGKGIEILKEHNIDVIRGVLEKDCKKHHRRFLCFQENKRPYITLKWAETKDHFMAPTKKMRSQTAEPYWISSRASRARVHLWRSKEQAILIGVNTLREDNPLLDVRMVHGMNPIPIIIDPKLSIDSSYHLYSNPDLIVFVDGTTKYKQEEYPFRILKIDFSKEVIHQLLEHLYRLKILSLFIEGGAYTLNEFIKSGIWDEARVIQSTNEFKDGIKAPEIKLNPTHKEFIESDCISYYHNSPNE